jgi:hypothetical protein
MELKLINFPGRGAVLALIAAFVWGLACGYFREPFWLVVVGAVFTNTLGFWLEWETLKRSGGDRPNFYLLVAAAYAFMFMIALGLVSVAALFVRLELR